MADSTDPAEAQKLREEIHRGFYGEGELIKTLLQPGQTAIGEELR